MASNMTTVFSTMDGNYQKKWKKMKKKRALCHQKYAVEEKKLL
jgi:hypothetical protein